MPPKILNNSLSGKINVFVSSNSNLIFSNLHSMILTLLPTILELLLLSKNFTTKPINFFLYKNHPNFHNSKSQIHPPLLYHSHYSLNHLFTINTTRTYNPIKPYYILSPYHDPTRFFCSPGVKLSISMMIFLPTQIPNNVSKCFPKMCKIVETPLDHLSRSLYTSLGSKHHSIAHLNYITAKLSSFILNKQYKYFPSTQNITEKIQNALPKHIPSSTDFSNAPPTAIVPPIPSYYVLQTVNTNVCINSFS